MLIHTSAIWMVSSSSGRSGNYTIPSTVTKIDDRAFSMCKNLNSITIPYGVTNIGYRVFGDCSGLTNVEIPSSISNIGIEMFCDCSNLRTVSIPQSVTNIQNYAFYGTALTDVYFDGTQTQWNAINIGNNNTPLYSAVIHYAETTYTVTYNANGGNESSVPANQEKTSGVDLTLSTIKPERANSSVGSYTVALNANGGSVNTSYLSAARFSSYTFKNWNTKADGSGTSYNAGASYTTDADVTLYAQWNSSTNTAAVTLPTPTREGCTFMGWAMDKNAVSGITSSYTPSGDVTLYAIWYADTSSGISVIESSEDPEILSFKFYQDVDGTDYVDLTNTTDTLTVEYTGSADPYKFVVEVDQPELINHVYITGTAEDGVRQMEASYDESEGTFVAQGFFDENDVFYRPDNIKLEYNMKSTAPEVGNALNWDEMTPYLGVLTNAEVSATQTGNTNSGTIDFSKTIEDLNNLALNYTIKIIDSNDGTQIGNLRSYYNSTEGILEYVVPGLNDSKYFAYLDQNDPHSWKMLLDDGLSTAGKVIEIQMAFMDTESSQYIFCEDALNVIGDIGTISKVVGKAYKICEDTEKLNEEIDRSPTIRDKDEAHRKAEELHHDKMQFMLLTTMLPLLVASGAVMGPAPAMLFTGIIGVMSAVSNTIYDYRVAGILGSEAVETDWDRSTQSTTGQCGEHVFYEYTGYYKWYQKKPTNEWTSYLDRDELTIYGVGPTYDNHDKRPYCPDANKVTVQDGVTSLGKRFFNYSTRMEEITISSSVKSVGALAFEESTALKSVELSPSIEMIPSRCFLNCTALDNVVIPRNVNRINSSAFYGCQSLKHIALSDQITYIGTNAFEGCTNLSSIDLPKSLATIGAGAFYSTNIEEITIPKGVQEVMFERDADSYEGGGSIGSWANSPFYNSKVAKITFEEGIEAIPARIALCAEKLKYVVLPDGVKTIEDSAFNGCPLLQSINFPEGLIRICELAFSYNSSLSNLSFPDSLQYIERSAFIGAQIEEIHFPLNLKEIGEYAFNPIPHEEEADKEINITVYFHGDRPTLGDNIFGDTESFHNISVKGYYPAGNTSWDGEKPTLGANRITWEAYTNTSYTVIYNANGGTGEPAKQQKLPNQVLTLSLDIPIREGWFFLGWSEDKNTITPVYLPGGDFVKDANTTLFALWGKPDFILPESLTGVESEAFAGAAFTFVKLPDQAISIGWHAFADCPNLAYICIPEQTNQIDAQAFGNMQGLTILGKTGSTAETYAQNHNFNFIAVP